MTASPTTGAHDTAKGSWADRPALAFGLRSLVFLAPIVASWLVTRATAGAYWRPPGVLGIAVWAAQLLVVGSTVVLLVGREAGKLLPLAALFNLSLAFPDQAPSRFKVALRSGTLRNLQAHVDDVLLNGYGATATETTTRIVELVTALSRHERLTRGHTERVRAYTDLIAEEMGVDEAGRNKLRWASMLHDIGKLAVPAEILNKAGRPTEEEWAILASHPVVGGELVEPLAEWLGEWRFATSQHHERWDGKGYPNQLAGTQISLAGRIVAVADAYDVITSARTYKKAMTPTAARQELVRCAGTQFDPAVVRAFLSVSIGNVSSKAGSIGWLVEFVRGIASLAAQTGNAAGGIVAATAVASVAAVAITVAPPATGSDIDASAFVSTVVINDPAERAITESVPGPGAARRGTPTTTSGATDPTPSAAMVSVANDGAEAPAAVVPTNTGGATTSTTTSTSTTSTPAPTTTTTTGASTTTAPVAGATTTTTRQASAPVAVADTARVTGTSSVTIDVLANDTDADGDIDQNSLTIVTAPDRGTAVVRRHRIRYTPGAGPDPVSFTYQVCDKTGLCATGQVTVTLL